MRLVFCGTPEFAVPTLQAVLDAGHEVALVLTQPDRPAGRKMELHAPPVKTLAVERGLPVMQPERIKRNEELRTRLEAIQPDAILVVAYGRIIPDWMLTLPRFGNLNLHGSLLPKYRGAAPVQWAVANGETETGVTTMRLNAGLDTGDVLLETRLPIGDETTASELFLRLAEVGAPLMLRTLEGLEKGTLQAKPQDHGKATLAPILTREDGRLALDKWTAAQVFDRWRGFYPWPGAWGEFRGKRFLVHAMRPVKADGLLPPAPGELRFFEGELVVGAAEGTILQLLEVQTEGKPRLPGAAFARDFQLKPGERIG
ncbi:MAG: methionyl-tRNA formyltransferase [Janthinobacterium lividum]